MSTVTDLLAEIDAFRRDRGIAETTFGRHAVNDGKFVGRLRAGADVTVGTVDRVRTYMASERARVSHPVPDSASGTAPDTEVAAAPAAPFPAGGAAKAAA